MSASYKNEIESSRRFWGYPYVSAPRIVENLKAEADSLKPEIAATLANEIGFCTAEGHEIYISMENARKDLKLEPGSEDEKAAVRFLCDHELGHYALVPYDLKTHLWMIYNANKALERKGIKSYEMAAQVANLFDDTVANSFIAERGRKPEVDFFYRRLVQENKNALGGAVGAVYRRSLEKLWDTDGHYIKKVGAEEEEAAGQIASILCSDTGMYDPNGWGWKIQQYASVLAKFIKQDAKSLKNAAQSIDSNGPSGQMREVQGRMQQGEDGAKGKKKQQTDGKPNGAERELEEQLKGLAKKIHDKQKYKELLAGVGLQGDPVKADIWYYRDLASEYEVNFVPLASKEGREYKFSPKRWMPGDSINDLDIMYTVSTQGVVIPGVTTGKWDYRGEGVLVYSENAPDLMILLDSSGSMTNPTTDVSKAVLAAFVASQSAFNVGASVSVINFSGRERSRLDNGRIIQEWTQDRDKVGEALVTYLGGGTELPTAETVEMAEKHKSEIPIQILTITDTQFYNFDEAFPYLEQATNVNPKNRGALFIIGQCDSKVKEKLEKINWELFPVNTAAELQGIVIGKAQEIYGIPTLGGDKGTGGKGPKDSEGDEEEQ